MSAKELDDLHLPSWNAIRNKQCDREFDRMRLSVVGTTILRDKSILGVVVDWTTMTSSEGEFYVTVRLAVARVDGQQEFDHEKTEITYYNEPLGKTSATVHGTKRFKKIMIINVMRPSQIPERAPPHSPRRGERGGRVRWCLPGRISQLQKTGR